VYHRLAVTLRPGDCRLDVGDPGGPARWPRPVVRPGASPVGPARWSNRDVRPLALCASALRRYDRPRSSPRWFPAPLRLAVAAPPGVGWACPPGLAVAAPPGVGWACPPGLAVAAPPGVGWACPPGLGVCCPARGRLGLSSRSRGLPPRPGSVGPVLPVSGFAAPPGVGWACPPGLRVCCPARGRLGLSSRSPGLPLSPCRLHSLGLARHLRPPSAYSPGPIAWCAALRAYRLVSLACRDIVLLAAHTQRPPPKGQRPMLLRCAQPQESGDHAVRVLERRARAHPGSAQEGVRGVLAPPVCPMPAAGAWAYRRCAPAPGSTVARAMRTGLAIRRCPSFRGVASPGLVATVPGLARATTPPGAPDTGGSGRGQPPALVPSAHGVSRSGERVATANGRTRSGTACPRIGVDMLRRWSQPRSGRAGLAGHGGAGTGGARGARDPAVRIERGIARTALRHRRLARAPRVQGVTGVRASGYASPWRRGGCLSRQEHDPGQNTAQPRPARASRAGLRLFMGAWWAGAWCPHRTVSRNRRGATHRRGSAAQTGGCRGPCRRGRPGGAAHEERTTGKHRTKGVAVGAVTPHYTRERTPRDAGPRAGLAWSLRCNAALPSPADPARARLGERGAPGAL